MNPTHTKALRLDNTVRDLRDQLDDITIGVLAWAVATKDDQSPLRSPSLEAGRGGHSTTGEDSDVALTPVEAAAFRKPDPLLEDALGLLAAVERGDVRAATRHARRIRRNVDPQALVDPCRKCGKRNPIRSKKSGVCTTCEREQQRERERVA